MLNEITSSVYRRLREKARLTKKDLAPLLEVSRYTVTKFENGRAQPTGRKMQKLLELARSTEEEAGQMVCEKLSERLDRPVGFLPRDAAREPTALATGNMLLKEYAHRLSASLLQALDDKIKTMRFMRLALEGHNTEMRQLVKLCMDRLRRGRE